MSKQKLNGANKGRVGMSIIFILFGIFCLYTLTKAFSVGFLVLGIAAIGIAVFNIYRTLAGKSGNKSVKSNKSGKGSDDFSL